jgi:2-phospho-L-lactate/phosphoenolpyruvate guanylyltransferase
MSLPSPPHAIDALVPLKRLAEAKTRLSDELAPAMRVDLMRALLEHTLRHAKRAPSVGRIVLVSSETESPAIAAEYGIAHFDDRGLPWNEALAAAIAETVESEAVLILSADLPLVTADDIEALIAAMPQRGMAIGRARDAGTNAVAMHPAGAVRTCFGARGSAARHAELAAEAGLRPVFVDRPGLAIDLDSPSDAREVLRRGVSEAVRAALVG